MQDRKRFIKYFIFILMLAGVFICIWGVPLKNARISVKSDRAEVSGTFTGTWSLIKGKDGVFTADEGWVFEGEINPDGGLWKGQLINYPISPEWRKNSIFDLPERYTGRVEESVLVDVKLKYLTDQKSNPFVKSYLKKQQEQFVLD